MRVHISLDDDLVEQLDERDDISDHPSHCPDGDRPYGACAPCARAWACAPSSSWGIP
jgi:hypothetical protein